MKNRSPSDTSAFAALLNHQFENYRSGFEPGETVEGIVTAVSGQFVTCDVKAKREAILPVADFTDETGAVSVAIGDKLRLRFLGMQDGTFLFTTKSEADAPMADRSLTDAFLMQMPIEGTVQAECNGGYEVTVGGKRAFCPFSQIARFKQEGEDYIGRKMTFLLMEYGQDDRGENIIVSRRALLEKEREEQRAVLFTELEPNQIRKGTVTRIVDFGVFVDIGGAEGLIPLREIAWQRDVKPQDVVKEGDSVDVMVLSVDPEANRISLSLRAVGGNPWDTIMERYPVGSVFNGKIVRIENFGAFVQIIPGIDGLISTGRLSGGKRILSPRDVVQEGQELEFQIEAIDTVKRRISLKLLDRRIADLQPGELGVGSEIEGIVESIQPFGVFVRLSEEKSGLLHISETDLPKQGSPVAQLERKFEPSSKIKVVVKSTDNGKISLTLPSRWAQAKEDESDDWRSHAKSTGSMGSLGDAFAGLNL